MDIILRNMYLRSVFLFYAMIFLIIIINIIFIKGHLDGRKIKKEVYNLRKDLDNDSVREYMTFLEQNNIAPVRQHQDLVRAGYEMVKMNDNIDKELVKELKIIILCKGILIV